MAKQGSCGKEYQCVDTKAWRGNKIGGTNKPPLWWKSPQIPSYSRHWCNSSQKCLIKAFLGREPLLEGSRVL